MQPWKKFDIDYPGRRIVPADASIAGAPSIQQIEEAFLLGDDGENVDKLLTLLPGLIDAVSRSPASARVSIQRLISFGDRRKAELVDLGSWEDFRVLVWKVFRSLHNEVQLLWMDERSLASNCSSGHVGLLAELIESCDASVEFRDYVDPVLCEIVFADLRGLLEAVALELLPRTEPKNSVLLDSLLNMSGQRYR